MRNQSLAPRKPSFSLFGTLTPAHRLSCSLCILLFTLAHKYKMKLCFCTLVGLLAMVASAFGFVPPQTVQTTSKMISPTQLYFFKRIFQHIGDIPKKDDGPVPTANETAAIAACKARVFVPSGMLGFQIRILYDVFLYVFSKNNKALFRILKLIRDNTPINSIDIDKTVYWSNNTKPVSIHNNDLHVQCRQQSSTKSSHVHLFRY